MTRIIATVEARMGSTRLPGKTLMPLPTGESLLDLVVARLRQVPSVAEVWVATTLSPKDDRVAEHCRRVGIACHRGDEEDVLDRVCATLKAAGGELVVQAGGDGPYVQPFLIEELLQRLQAGPWDYVCNDMRLTYPLGVYGHVLPAALLHDLNERRDLSAADRVDVVRAVFEHPEAYRILSLTAPAAYCHPELRLTIDYPEDEALLKRLLTEQGHEGLELEAVLESSRLHPEWFAPVRALVQASAAHLVGAVGYTEAPGGLRHG